VEITQKIRGKFFEKIGCTISVTFFILPNLKDFDGIIGDDTLKEIGALVDRKNNTLILDNGAVIQLKNRIIESLGHFVNECVNQSTKAKIYEMVKEYQNLFGPFTGKETV